MIVFNLIGGKKYETLGGYNLIWPIRGCAARHGMIFVLFIRNRVYNFAQVCPKRCTFSLS